MVTTCRPITAANVKSTGSPLGRRQWGKLTTTVESSKVITPNIGCKILVVTPVASFSTPARSGPYPLMYATPLGSSMRIITDVDGSRLDDIGLSADVFWFALGY